MESRLQREHNEVMLDQVVHMTDALPTTNGLDGETRVDYDYYMAPYDTTIIISSVSNAFDVILPPVSEARGKIYCITLVAYVATAVGVIDYKDDSEDYPATISLAANYDRVTMYSDGSHWWILGTTMHS